MKAVIEIDLDVYGKLKDGDVELLEEEILLSLKSYWFIKDSDCDPRIEVLNKSATCEVVE